MSAPQNNPVHTALVINEAGLRGEHANEQKDWLED